MLFWALGLIAFLLMVLAAFTGLRRKRGFCLFGLVYMLLIAVTCFIVSALGLSNLWSVGGTWVMVALAFRWLICPGKPIR